MKITYYAAMSSDGFIAREDGDVSWLDDLDIDFAETGAETFFNSIDGLVMGRDTYDFVFNYGSWPYEDKPSWVCTSQPLKPLPGAVLHAATSPQQIIDEANKAGLKHLWFVGGGKLASSFLDEGLLSNLSISEMPITLGAGIPLFSDHSIQTLQSVSSQTHEKNGFRQLELVLV